MTLSFCTTLDVTYLPRGLALYRSLERHASPFHLHVLCMDEAVAGIIERLGLPSATTVRLEELESVDPDLRSVKGDRSTSEYCWTVKPSLCRHLIERQEPRETLTYLDSDLLFFDDPRALLAELGDASIMIVPHRFSPWCVHWSAYEGTYNGGWVTFRNDEPAREALAWWRERCLEWCYDRREDGKFADQKYLEDFPRRFSRVRVLRHPGAGLAPWNADRHDLTMEATQPRADGRPIVFYHYSSLELFRMSPGSRMLAHLSREFRLARDPVPLVWRIGSAYELRTEDEALIWAPYVRELGEAVNEIRALQPAFDGQWSALEGRKELRRLTAKLARRVLPTRVHAALRRALGSAPA